MPQTVCHVCGSDKWHRTEDHLDGHTLLSSEEWCDGCGYRSFCNTGNFSETIGRWAVEWHHTESDEAFEKRRAAREVAMLIRRHELGLIHTSVKPFAEALSNNPGDFTAAKVLADWVEDHPEEFGELSGYQGTFCHLLRIYDDASGFLLCQYCQGSGEVYEHAANCTSELCALAGGIFDCYGQVTPCVCQPQPD